MGSQPNRKLAKRGPRIRSRKLRNDLRNAIDKNDYKKASSHITKAVRKSGGKSYISGILAAGVIAYAEYKTSKESSIKKISGDAVTKLPKDLKQNLTLAGRDSIRFALYNTLSKRRV